VEDVRLREPLVVGAEQARPGDEAAQHEIDEAAERRDRPDRPDDRPADAPAQMLVEPHERSRARQNGDERRYPRQHPPLLREQGGLFLVRKRERARIRHELSLERVIYSGYKSVDPTVFFSPDEVARASAYHRPLYVAVAVDIALSSFVTALLAFSWLGDRLYDATAGPWWARTVVFTLLVLALVEALRLPLLWWRGFLRERRWGFSTQSFGGWALDQSKAFVVGFVLTAVALLALLGSIRLFPTWWPLVAAVGAALLVLLLVFVAPLVLGPLFHRLPPPDHGQLAAAL